MAFGNRQEMKSRIHLIIRIFAAVFAIMWMFRIFSFSSDVAEVSGTVSRSMSFNMIEKISRHLHLGWDEERIEAVSKPVEKYLRKAAHMYEYAVLALLWGIALDSFVIGVPAAGDMSCVGRTVPAARLLIPFAICVIYAVTDEFHQVFVDGRSGEIRDVIIDTSGAAAGLLLGWFAVRIIIRIRSKHQK